jgi:tetratricopeptide (TPR) repeat protein
MMGEKSPFAVKPPQAKVETPQKPEKAIEGKSLDDAKKLFEEKKYTEALAVVDSLLAGDQNNAELHAWKGNIMGSLAQGNPADMIKYGMGAMQEYEKALELDPKNVSAHFGRGMGRLMAPEGFGGDVNGAIEDLEFASAKGSFPEACYYLGVAYQRKGLKDKAKDAFKKALSLKPNYPEAAKALAEIK